jgi:hypothetical protein
MPDSLDQTSPASSFTLLPKSRWTPTSIAAVACCFLFVASVLLAVMIHPSIPAGLVVAIVLFPLGAVVLGMTARFRSAAAPARGAKAAVALGSAALVLTLATLLITPSLCRAREPANRVKCASNLRQIGEALASYAEAHGGQFPPTVEALAAASDLSPAVFNCPSSSDIPADVTKAADWATAFQPDGHHLSYVYVAGGLNASTVKPTSILAYENLQDHLDAGMNVLYGDYHVEWADKPGADRIIAEHPSPNPTTRPGSESHVEPRPK